jgi:hypothetical protein
MLLLLLARVVVGAADPIGLAAAAGPAVVN